MNVAHRGAFFFVISLLAACGGAVSDGANAADTGPHDDGGDGQVAGTWASYTMRITSSDRKWTFGAPSPTPGDPTSGWSGRFDFDAGNGAGSMAHAVVLPMFTSGTTIDAPSGTTITFTAAKDDALFHISGYAGFQNVSDSYDTFSVQISSDGTPYAGTLSGRTMATSGDVAWDGTVTATVAFDRDTIGPSWRWSGATPFATVTLPWDPRTVEASEPYEESIGIDRMIAGSIDPSAVDATSITSAAHGETRDRGATFTLIDWNLSGSLGATEALVHDFANNVTTFTKPSTFIPGVDVALRSTPSWGPADGGAAATTWGSTSIVEADCAGCEPEMVLGPVHAGGCAPGSEGGLAIRLPASGPYLVRLSVHAKPPPYPSPEPPPGVSTFLHVQLVNPGKNPIDVDLSSVKWPSTPATDGSYDSGFVDVYATPSGAFPETGIAISAGGLGTTNPCFGGGGGPAVPATWSGLVTVEHIVQAPPP
jgi:hypothetical protein